MVGRNRPVPTEPKIYHIVHVDRLPSIIADNHLWSDGEVVRRMLPGTSIGMADIKRRRLEELNLDSHPSLYVGECVPFYFCPRSVMLYILHMSNHPGLAYRGGQGPIVHLQADLRQAVRWAEANRRRWAFTLSNAGSYHFEDYFGLEHLGKVVWGAIEATDWREPHIKEGKQAEFLVERSFPWELVSLVGVYSPVIRDRVRRVMLGAGHQPVVDVAPAWYY